MTFEDLARYDRHQYLITCSTPGQDTLSEGDSRQGSGLVPGHAYTLIGAATLPPGCGAYAGAQLLKLRNPWGSFEWGGEVSPYLPTSPHISPYLRNP